MTNDIYSLVDQLKEEYKTDDPTEIARQSDIEVIDLYGTIPGYAMRISRVDIMGLNVNLSTTWYRYTGWHELGHIKDGHVRMEGCSQLLDQDLTNCSYRNNLIPYHEKIANLGAAHAVLDDQDVLDATGYDQNAYREYRRLSAEYAKFCQKYQDLLDLLRFQKPTESLLIKLKNLRRNIRTTSEELKELESDFISISAYRSFEDIAADLGTHPNILGYKLEGMRLRGLDIDPREIEQYSKTFDNAMEEYD